ncbi:hypothetical protein DPMN_050896 [Dreissena polymorpha]|uniref:Uncharacterized protein n=1 Tax=Dreissena polymorpha TaxID=45954 RepID=A0A9D4HLQ1_DREPO|nr:hypothetical protein DPMN_050896 [Dreissena polymorpha]
MSGRSSQGSAARRSAFMAALEITGRRLHPRDGFPSTLSVLSIAVPGSLYRATPRCSWDYSKAPPSSPRSAPYVSHTGGLAVPLLRPPTDGTSGRVGPVISRR